MAMGNRKRKNPLSGLLETLLHPDQEELETKDRLVVNEAANLLQVGEFQLIQLAYRDWHGDDLPEAMVALLFKEYMLRDAVPHWARHYARTIIDGFERGNIDENAAHYHRYDHDYITTVPQGILRFCFAVGCLIFFVGGGIILADLSAGESATMFPPYLNVNDLPKSK